jgi:signal transduction histidine kinase
MMALLATPWPSVVPKTVELGLLTASFACLIQFAVEVLTSGTRHPTRTRIVVAALLALVVLVVTTFGARSPEAFPSAEAAVRYLLGIPGSVLAALALLAVRRSRHAELEADGLRTSLSFAAGIFVVYGLLAGVFVPPAPFFPASWVNADSFHAATGIPVEIFRTGCALLIAAALSEAFVIESAKEHHIWERKREEFIGVVAHDLRSPINTIAMGADFLQKLLDSGDQLDQARVATVVRNLRSSASRLSRMVSDLLDTSRIEANRLDLQLASVEVLSLLRSVIERWTSSAAEHPLKLGVPESLPRILADADRVEQVLLNLLSNAAKYSSPASEIRVDAFRRELAIEIAITNLGSGLLPDEQAKLFRRFYRASSTGKGEGLGLGLYISKGLVEAHGGEIWVDSEPGAYTTFSFTLPFDGPPATRSATHPMSVGLAHP